MPEVSMSYHFLGASTDEVVELLDSLGLAGCVKESSGWCSFSIDDSPDGPLAMVVAAAPSSALFSLHAEDAVWILWVWDDQGPLAQLTYGFEGEGSAIRHRWPLAELLRDALGAHDPAQWREISRVLDFERASSISSEERWCTFTETMGLWSPSVLTVEGLLDGGLTADDVVVVGAEIVDGADDADETVRSAAFDWVFDHSASVVRLEPVHRDWIRPPVPSGAEIVSETSVIESRSVIRTTRSLRFPKAELFTAVAAYGAGAGKRDFGELRQEPDRAEPVLRLHTDLYDGRVEFDARDGEVWVRDEFVRRSCFGWYTVHDMTVGAAPPGMPRIITSRYPMSTWVFVVPLAAVGAVARFRTVLVDEVVQDTDVDFVDSGKGYAISWIGGSGNFHDLTEMYRVELWWPDCLTAPSCSLYTGDEDEPWWWAVEVRFGLARAPGEPGVE